LIPDRLIGYILLLKGCPTEAVTPVRICAWRSAGVIADLPAGWQVTEVDSPKSYPSK